MPSKSVKSCFRINGILVHVYHTVCIAVDSVHNTHTHTQYCRLCGYENYMLSLLPLSSIYICRKDSTLDVTSLWLHPHMIRQGCKEYTFKHDIVNNLSGNFSLALATASFYAYSMSMQSVRYTILRNEHFFTLFFPDQTIENNVWKTMRINFE